MKNRFLTLLMTAILVVSLVPVLANSSGTGIGINIEPEEFPVMIWGCGDFVTLEDDVEEGRGSNAGQQLAERTNNYAFEGEQVGKTVLVMDKNKINPVEVVSTIGPTQGVGNDIEAECTLIDPLDEDANSENGFQIPAACNARILEEDLTGTEFDLDTQAFYNCVFTVETPDSMQGEFFLNVEAIKDDSSAVLDENTFWFFNPAIAVSVEGEPEFTEVRPGSVAYSSTLLVGNDAEAGSGVLLDMFISGTDFYDPDNSGAKCPDTNQLQLSNTLRSQANIVAAGGSDEGSADAGTLVNHVELDCQAGTLGLTDSTNADHLCYYAANGAYSTASASNADAEGYVPMVYGTAFGRDFYNDAEVIRNPGTDASGLLDINGVAYHAGNVVSPGSEIAVTFKLGLPEPCTGNFNSGSIFFWGEAV